MMGLRGGGEEDRHERDETGDARPLPPPRLIRPICLLCPIRRIPRAPEVFVSSSLPPPRRVLFINPPTGLYRRDDRCQCTVEDQTVQVIFPPMDLALSAACAEQAGAVCRIEDYPAARRTWDDFIQDLRAFQPELLILNSTTATLDGDLQSCRIARELFPDILTAGKGETLIYEAVAVLRDYPPLDLVLPNEGEEAVAELVRGVPIPEIRGMHFRHALLEGRGLSLTPNCTAPERKAQASSVVLRREAEGRPIAGLSAPMRPVTERQGEPIYFTGKRPLQPRLDALPLPARHLLRNELYRSPETGNPLTVIHGNRGCPAKCIFCPAGVLTDFSVRYRSVENILAELRQCVEQFHIREFLFHGDTFTLNKRWLLDLCGAIREARLDLHWGCNSRVDTMDDERAAAMKRAGCWVVAFGIESGDAELLDRMKKNTTLDQAREAVAVCKRNGLRVHTFFVIGLPWETPETLERTYRFARELDPDFFDFNIATPLPGTELHEIARAERLFDADYDPTRAGYAGGSLRTFSGLTSRDFEAWRRRKLLAMYLRPRYIARTLWRSGSPRIAANYARAGFRRFRQLLRRAAAR